MDKRVFTLFLVKNLKMFKLIALFVAVAFIAGQASSFSLSMSAAKTSNPSLDRRSFALATGAAIVVGTGVTVPTPAFADEDPYKDFITTESGLKYKVTKEGTGKIPETGMTVKAHYTGWLDDFDSIKKFDSSRDRGRPFTFRVGGKNITV